MFYILVFLMYYDTTMIQSETRKYGDGQKSLFEILRILHVSERVDYENNIDKITIK